MVSAVPVEFAEGLERELAASKAEVERLKAERELYLAANADVKRIAEERNKAEAEVKRLRRVLQFIETDRATHDCTGYYRGIAFAALKGELK